MFANIDTFSVFTKTFIFEKKNIDFLFCREHFHLTWNNFVSFLFTLQHNAIEFCLIGFSTKWICFFYLVAHVIDFSIIFESEIFIKMDHLF